MLLFAFVLGCGGTRQTPARATQSSAGMSGAPEKLVQLARRCANGVGTLNANPTRGSRGFVIVIQENHSSILSQIEIAIMLLRLHQQASIVVGVEGAATGTQLNTPRVRRLFELEKDKSLAFDSLTALLAQGEISAAEYVAVLSPTPVHGLEQPDLYAKELTVTGNPEAEYLIRIGAAALSREEATQLAKVGDRDRTWQRILAADPWVTQEWRTTERLDRSTEQVLEQMHRIRERARSRQVYIEPEIENDFERVLEFFEVTNQRSRVMTLNMLSISRAAPQQLAVMLVGSAHGNGVQSTLAQADYGWLAIQPTSIDSSKHQLTTQQFKSKMTGKWAARSSSSLGRQLNGCRKPGPILQDAEGETAVALMELSGIFARAHRDRTDLNAVRAGLQPELGKRLSSLEVDGSDLVLGLRIEDAPGVSRTIYGRARAETAMSRVSGADPAELLTALLADYRSDGYSKAASKYGDHVTRIGSDVYVVFGATKREVADFELHEASAPNCAKG